MDGWEGIEEFVAVARTGSFIAGAASLGVSRTHMSRALARLEDRLGAQLLHRTTRRVLLSPTGQTFLDHCIRLVQERDEAVALIRDQGEPRGDLRITCCVALGERFIAPVARQFAKQHRQLTVYLDVTDRTIDLVAEGYDLGVRTGNLPSSDLIAAKIASRRSRTCAAPAYLERMGTPEKIADLNEHDCLTGTTLQWHFSEKGDEILYRPRPVWSCNNGYAVWKQPGTAWASANCPISISMTQFNRASWCPFSKSSLLPRSRSGRSILTNVTFLRRCNVLSPP